MSDDTLDTQPPAPWTCETCRDWTGTRGRHVRWDAPCDNFHAIVTGLGDRWVSGRFGCRF